MPGNATIRNVLPSCRGGKLKATEDSEKSNKEVYIYICVCVFAYVSLCHFHVLWERNISGLSQQIFHKFQPIDRKLKQTDFFSRNISTLCVEKSPVG